MFSKKSSSMRLMVAAFVVLVALSPLAVQAEENAHAGHGATSVEDIYAPAMRTMHKNMMIKPTGDADADFVLGMIPHHQGAIDMAKIVLEHGKDPEIKKLAEEVVRAQESEIAFMKAWLKKHGH